MSAKRAHRESTLFEAEPSRRSAALFTLAAIFSLAGLADAGYLAIEHLSGRSVQCQVTHCSEVLSSPYAVVAGVPIAAVGAIAYFSAFSLATLAAFQFKGAVTLLRGLAGLMVAAALWFLFVQAVLLRAFCEYCLLSAATTGALAIVLLLERRKPARGGSL